MALDIDKNRLSIKGTCFFLFDTHIILSNRITCITGIGKGTTDMDKVRVLLADDNRSMLMLLSEYLEKKPDIEVVGCISDGGEVIGKVSETAPDVVVLDVILPRFDGFSALEMLSESGMLAGCRVIMLTGLSGDDFIARALRLGASYYMVKPFDMELLYKRICEIARRSENPAGNMPAAPEQENADEAIVNLFLTLGIPAHIKGYQYLREAVKMVLADRDVINRITKELYPGIAKKFDTSASKVERAMRHAIEVAWSRGRLDAVNRMYGYKVFSPEDKPTNGEFISCVSEKLRG